MSSIFIETSFVLLDLGLRYLTMRSSGCVSEDQVVYCRHSHRPSETPSVPSNKSSSRLSKRSTTPSLSAKRRANGSHVTGDIGLRSHLSSQIIWCGAMLLVAILVLQYGQQHSILCFSISAKQRLPMRWLQGWTRRALQGHLVGSNPSPIVRTVFVPTGDTLVAFGGQDFCWTG
jgi:hypothetical protein